VIPVTIPQVENLGTRTCSSAGIVSNYNRCQWALISEWLQLPKWAVNYHSLFLVVWTKRDEELDTTCHIPLRILAIKNYITYAFNHIVTKANFAQTNETMTAFPHTATPLLTLVLCIHACCCGRGHPKLLYTFSQFMPSSLPWRLSSGF
jgi:hypothetical protein